MRCWGTLLLILRVSHALRALRVSCACYMCLLGVAALWMRVAALRVFVHVIDALLGRVDVACCWCVVVGHVNHALRFCGCVGHAAW